ncbi:MAG: helix-turn-helix domain-containing protein, partial [Verrucomicrobiales bacterium]|nr:helix-turn-helix domain-containing protein [Verrucomicrobiales bacterium]
IELERWILRELNDPFWRLYIPVAGEAVVTRNVDGQEQSFRLEPGYAYLIPPRTTISSTHTEPFSKWYVHFTLGHSGDRVIPGIYPVTVTPVMSSILDRLRGLGAGQFPWLSAGLVSEALHQLAPEIWRSRHLDSRVERAMEFMYTNLSIKLTTDQVAAVAGMSVRNLNHLFNQDLHMSPMRVLQDFRLDKACQLLRHSDKSIEQVAEECGFPNRNYFSRMLKQHRGTSPAAYRESEV